MALPANGDDSIEALKKRLDRWGAPESSEKRSGLGEGLSRGSVPSGFDAADVSASGPAPHSAMLLARKILFASVLFFGVAVIAGLLFAFSGRNVFSPEDVEISAAGPVAVKGGEELVLQVVIANKNNVRLETADFAVEYPAGSRDPEDSGKELRRTQELIGDIEPGEIVTRTVRAVLYGEEGAERRVYLSLDYRTADSSAIFTAEKEYAVVISSSPVGVSLSLPPDTLSGAEIALDITATAQGDAEVNGLLISAQYPPGFRFRRAEPAPSKGTSLWLVEALKPGEAAKIRVVGVLEGQDSEIKSFRVNAGIPSEKNPDSIATTYTSVFKTLTIERPQLGTTLKLAGSEEPEVVVRGGEDVRSEIEFKNNLAEPVRDAVVRVRFTGAAFDKTSVTVDGRGFYQSSVPEIVWSKETMPELELLEPGESALLSFGFAGIPAFQNSSLKNRSVAVDVSVSGTRTGTGQKAGVVETNLSRRVVLPAEVQLVARSLYSIGPFTNTGPVPPAIEKTTTYTVVWSVVAAGSDLSGATVEATLPSFVKWLGQTSPSGETVAYNAATGKVTWSLKDLRAGTGGISSAREASFQVSVTPSLAQLNSPLPLTSDVAFTGNDTWSRGKIVAPAAAVTTDTVTDPKYSAGKGTVVK